MEPLIWSVISSLAAALAAIFAGFELWRSRRESSLRVTFEHIRDVVRTLQPIRKHDASDMQAEVLDFYRGGVDRFSERASEYLVFLGALDLLALAYEEGLLRKTVVLKYLQTVLNSNLVPSTFLLDFKAACKDEEVYINLSALLKELPKIERR